MQNNTGKRALITGINGFTGRYMARELEAAGYQVFGTDSSVASSDRIYAVDLCNRKLTTEMIAAVQPDVIVHLAAISFVAHGDAEQIYRVNIVGTRNLLEALATRCINRPHAVLLASSANIYGNTDVGIIDETVPPAPANDYAVSKLAMEHMARQWDEQLPLIIVRPFNYTGVGQADNFLLPKIVGHYRRHASDIELGNLDVTRDFSDVRTVVSAYRRLIEAAPAGQTFNICSGVGYSLAEILNMAAQIAGYEIKVSVNPAFVRANEVKRLIGSNAKLVRAIGEVPPISLIETLRWMAQNNG